MIKLHLAAEEGEAVVAAGACASGVGKRLGGKLGIWTKGKKVKVGQRDGSS